MKEQKIIITRDDFEINREIEHGWLVKSVTAQHCSTGSPTLMYGYFCFVLEKKIKKNENKVTENS